MNKYLLEEAKCWPVGIWKIVLLTIREMQIKMTSYHLTLFRMAYVKKKTYNDRFAVKKKSKFALGWELMSSKSISIGRFTEM